MLTRSGASSHSGSAVVIHQALLSYGVDADAVFSSVGLNIKQLQRESNRIPEEIYDSLVLAAIEASEDPAFGLRYADFCHPTTFSALGLALLASETLSDFCARWVRYFALVNTSEAVHYESNSAGGILSERRIAANAQRAVERAHGDAFLALVVKYIRMMYHPNYVPARITSTWPGPENGCSVYRDYFGIEPEFTSERNAIYINEDDLNRRLPAANAELARQNDLAVVAFLSRLNKIDLPAQVNRKLIELLPSGSCTTERIAASLNMSVRSLSSKLSQAGTSYQQLLDGTRKRLAEDYLSQQELSVSEIAYLLGFTDASNFSRAFRRWSGQSPKDFRLRLSEVSDV